MNDFVSIQHVKKHKLSTHTPQLQREPSFGTINPHINDHPPKLSKPLKPLYRIFCQPMIMNGNLAHNSPVVREKWWARVASSSRESGAGVRAIGGRMFLNYNSVYQQLAL
jgi:hypothetical protein